MLHHFHDEKHPSSQGSINADQFTQLIEQVGYDDILPAREWLRRSLNGMLRDQDRCITFDDNLRCQFDVAYPVLRRKDITAFWFVYTSVLEGNIERLEVYRKFRHSYFSSIDDFYAAFFHAIERTIYKDEVRMSLQRFSPGTYLANFPFYTDNDRRFRYVRDEVLGPDRYYNAMDEMIMSKGVVNMTEFSNGLWMDKRCIRQLHNEGHVIGLHSHTHPTRMANLDSATQKLEYTKNYDCLADLLGEPPLAVSHPNNSYNGKTLKILQKLGIRLGFRANMAQPVNSELEYPREDHANIIKAMQA